MTHALIVGVCQGIAVMPGVSRSGTTIAVAMLLGMPGLSFAFGILALVLFAALLAGGRWITTAGFSPFWGAFTFPLAAFSSLMMMLAGAGYGEFFRIVGGLALVAATFFIPWIALKVGQMWLKGALAAKTNAAVA